MNTLNIIINITGLAIIVWIIWYFWLWKGESFTVKENVGGIQEIEVTVKGGYQPSTIVVKVGTPLRLNFTRREASTCGEEVVLPGFGMRAHLPENRTVPVEVTPEQPGEYEFTCGMNMYKGKLVVQ
jgi:plastocyanin domain-containing protein